MSEFEGYQELYETGHENKEPVAPEDEFFHSIYIAGAERENHVGVTEQIGKLQIRGVEYNKDKVHFIITHTKQILAKITRNSTTGRENVECFSYQTGGPPWIGTSGRTCGINSAERAADQFCNSCRAQMIVAGLYCDENGKPYLSETNKPTFIFIRGKGMKYSGVAEYLNEISKMELDPIFKPETDESKKFEKAVVNNKRFVTEVVVTEAKSNYGMKKVFSLKTGTKLPNQTVMDILKVAKQTIEKFNDKMDWSKNINVSGYTQVPDGNQIPDSDSSASKQPDTKSQSVSKEPVAPAVDSPFNFEDLSF